MPTGTCGENPAVTTGALIGLAEYTNANFLSEDRIFTENDVDPLKRFPYPNRSQRDRSKTST